jgi:opacity protein-like surface antigen
MNLPTLFMPRPSAAGRGLFSAVAARERLGASPPCCLVPLLVRIRKLGLTALVTAILCSTISRLVAADPSVEVYTQGSVVTNAEEGEEGETSPLAYVPRFVFTIGGGYDDNVNVGTGSTGLATSTGDGGSIFTQTRVTFTKDLRTARTQINIKLGGGVVYYFDRPSRSTDVTGTLDVSLHHNISPRLKLDAIINAAYLAEPDFSTDLGPQRRANYFRTEDTLTASYKWSQRFSTDTSYVLRIVDYEDNAGGTGGAGNVSQDRVEQSFREAFRYRWSPRTTLTAEYRFGVISYDNSLRDSSTHTALGGFDYEINSRLNGTFRGGATYRTYEDETKGGRTDPNFSGSLHYEIGPSTSLNWTASYSIEAPNAVESLSRTTARTGLELSYAFSKRVTTNLTLNYHHDENDGALTSGPLGANQGAYTSDAFELMLGAKYAVTKRLSLDVGYTHSELDSGGPTTGYSRNRYTAGLTLSY